MLDKKRNFYYEGITSAYEQADIVIFGIPFDGTCSNRPGTRFGPSAIRGQLDGLETYSLYQDKDMTDFALCDLGNMELPLGNTEKTLEMICEETKGLLEDKKRIIGLGGEHLITYPIIKAYAQTYERLHVVHLDAHADLRDTYLGEKLSHATVIRRVYELLDEGMVFSFGIRSGTKEEFDFAKKYTNMEAFSLHGMDQIKKAVADDPVYVTIDLDVLDPSIFSGTGTPEPGGVTFNALIHGLSQLEGLNIVGCDIVELSPDYDSSGVSTVTASKVLREMALIMS